MKSRTFFATALLVTAILCLPACVSQRPTLAANEDTPLQPCEQVTGTRIQAKRSHCAPVGVVLKSFTAEQLQATGEMDLAEALRDLDPAFH